MRTAIIMTEQLEHQLSSASTEELMQRKRELENGLSAATMHGVEIPEDLANELQATQNELARRSKAVSHS